MSSWTELKFSLNFDTFKRYLACELPNLQEKGIFLLVCAILYFTPCIVTETDLIGLYGFWN
jgi:hypothetical protein